jgi:hypothetical protein
VSGLARALIALREAFGVLRIPYMVVGGLANAEWGVPRATLDVDATVWVEEEDLPAVIASLCGRFRCLVEDPASFVGTTRVLPLEVEQTKADVVFGLLPYEREAIARAVEKNVEGVPVRFCTAEDLILHKVISQRERDREDVHGILKAQRGQLDREYLEPRLRELASLLQRPEIWEEYLYWR